MLALCLLNASHLPSACSEHELGSLEVLATPGHPPGHLAFLDTRDCAVISGDAFQTLGGVAVAGTFKLLFPLPALATWHKEFAQQSARTLLAREPSVLAVGHGRMLEDPQAAMKRAIRVMGQSLAKRETPGRYALTLQAPDPGDQELQAIAQQIVDVLRSAPVDGDR